MRTFLFLIFPFILLSCSSGGSQTLLSPSDFETKLQSTSGKLLDVRTPDEFALDHLANAQNLDFYSPNFDQEINKLDKSGTYFVYCQRGGRSAEAFAKLKKAGFTNVYELEGGVTNWEKAGKPLEKAEAKVATSGMTVEQYNEMVKSQKIVLVDFSAKWCGPCRKLSPMVDKMGQTRSKDMKVVMIDVDDNQQIASVNSIEELPTLAWYKNGKLVLRMIGLRTEKDLNETLDSLLKD